MELGLELSSPGLTLTLGKLHEPTESQFSRIKVQEAPSLFFSTVPPPQYTITYGTALTKL